LVGTRGSVVFSQERFNELHLFTTGGPANRNGFRKLLAGPSTPPYEKFCPAPGHQLGFNDLKTIEVFHLIESIATGRSAYPDFREGYEVQRVITAALASTKDKRWIGIGEAA
jgi:predicted dehydrogenase